MNPATTAMLHAVSGVPVTLLENRRVLPRRSNWLRFPWNSKRSGGGAFVLGQRIRANGNLFGGTCTNDRALLFRLAHEVGHLTHAAAFPYSATGKFRYIMWSASQYVTSYLRNGCDGYRRTHMEQEAETGRWVLRTFPAVHQEPLALIDPVVENKLTSVERMIRSLEAEIDDLHEHYPGW